MISKEQLIQSLNATKWVETPDGIQSVGGEGINGGNIGDVGNFFDVFTKNLGVSPHLKFPEPGGSEGHNFLFEYCDLPRLAKLGMIFPGSEEQKLKDDALCSNHSATKTTAIEVLRFYRKYISVADRIHIRIKGFTSEKERKFLMNCTYALGADNWDYSTKDALGKVISFLINDKEHRFAKQLFYDQQASAPEVDASSISAPTALEVLKYYERQITYDSARRKIHIKGLTGPSENALIGASLKSLGAEIPQPETGAALARVATLSVADEQQHIAKQLVEGHINFEGRAHVKMPGRNT